MNTKKIIKFFELLIIDIAIFHFLFDIMNGILHSQEIIDLFQSFFNKYYENYDYNIPAAYATIFILFSCLIDSLIIEKLIDFQIVLKLKNKEKGNKGD